MTEIIDPLLQARALQELARKFPTDSKSSAAIFWENAHGTAGVSLSSEGRCVVFLFDAEQEVESLFEAGELLKCIFADQTAAVKAYASQLLVFNGLVQTNDPDSGFDMLSSPALREKIVPEFDYVAIATWSRGIHEDSE